MDAGGVGGEEVVAKFGVLLHGGKPALVWLLVGEADGGDNAGPVVDQEIDAECAGFELGAVEAVDLEVIEGRLECVVAGAVAAGEDLLEVADEVGFAFVEGTGGELLDGNVGEEIGAGVGEQYADSAEDGDVGGAVHGLDGAAGYAGGQGHDLGDLEPVLEVAGSVGLEGRGGLGFGWGAGTGVGQGSCLGVVLSTTGDGEQEAEGDGAVKVMHGARLALREGGTKCSPGWAGRADTASEGRAIAGGRRGPRESGRVGALRRYR